MAVIAFILGLVCIKQPVLLAIFWAVAVIAGGTWGYALSKFRSAEAAYNNEVYQAEQKYRSELARANEHNDQADAEQRAWDTAWSNWDKNVLKASYLTSTNNVFGRFAAAINSSVNLAIDEVFVNQRHATVKSRKETEISEQQLNEQVARKKASFK